MGIVTKGIPEDIVTELAKIHGASVFIETGTMHGGTTKWASKHFETVHTIERAESLYNQHQAGLSAIKGVHPHLGDSREVLPGIIKELGSEKAVYWLDGHWAGGVTAGKDDECPVLDELANVSNRTKDIILIDDARLFLCAPPEPHNPDQWPTISEIIDALPKGEKRPFVQIVDDVIFIVPNEDALIKILRQYAQRRANFFWSQFSQNQRGLRGLKEKIRRLLSNMKRILKAD